MKRKKGYQVGLILLVIVLEFSCSDDKLEEKGFSVGAYTEESEIAQENGGINRDSLMFETSPKNVLLTGNHEHRLTPIYKVNYNKNTKESFIGSNYSYSNYSELSEREGSQWNENFMPGFEAIYGYNMVNVSHYNNQTQTENKFFDKPALVKTLYYPAFSNDTLNFNPVIRNYYMVSTYDEDTNKDGFINMNDLRRFYFFDINAKNSRLLVPENYSVLSSEYDPANDYMYVFAKLDQNNNGKADINEEIHVFWIDLKNPEKIGREY